MMKVLEAVHFGHALPSFIAQPPFAARRVAGIRLVRHLALGDTKAVQAVAPNNLEPGCLGALHVGGDSTRWIIRPPQPGYPLTMIVARLASWCLSARV